MGIDNHRHGSLHSSDAKRGVMYVKDEDGWDKDKDHSKMAAAINKVSKSRHRRVLLGEGGGGASEEVTSLLR